ncbi:MAG: BrnT family toxin [Pseudolabrys sp.]|nr:BrnT family toxin [Pseudolabrys sp.]
MGASADGFDWDDGNSGKCQKHGLSVADIEHVVAHTETLIVHDIKNSARETRFIAVGRTPGGRYAFVAFTPRVHGDQTLLRPISARFMHAREIARYEKESASFQDRRGS